MQVEIKRMVSGKTTSGLAPSFSFARSSSGYLDGGLSVRYANCSHEDDFNCTAANCLFKAIKEKLSRNNYCKAIIGLSGGETPKEIYKILNNMKYKIDWTRVIIFLVDERFVPCNDINSNQFSIMNYLLKDVNIPRSNLIFPDTSLPIDECVEKYQRDLSMIFTLSESASIVTLGMGIDGHIASWFPPLQKCDFDKAMNPNILAAHTTTEQFTVRDRITISLSLISKAETKLVFLKGKEKVDLFKEITSLPNSNICDYPIVAVIKSSNTTIVSYPSVFKLNNYNPTLSHTDETTNLTFIILGASGDLAYKKIYPALFSLFCQGYNGNNFVIAGYGRSQISFEDFWLKISEGLKYLDEFYMSKSINCGEKGKKLLSLIDELKTHCIYISGGYTDTERLNVLNEEIENLIRKKHPETKKINKVFYLAVPPIIFSSSVAAFKKICWSKSGWNRVVVEKPFGHDLKSSNELSEEFKSVLNEKEIYRIDHYLGKEMVLNLLTFRFANLAFMPLFHRFYVKCVRITFKEDFGVKNRGGYFEKYGIIRDVMQNHMLQLLTLVGMEKPPSNTDDDIRQEKVKLLKQIPSVELEEAVLGQYCRNDKINAKGYLEENGISSDSICSTFCTCVLWIKNERWQGVPFIMKAGKAVEKSVKEIRIQLHSTPGFVFGANLPPNELIIQVEPKECIYIKFLTNKPGFESEYEETELDLSIRDRFDLDRLPEAYERLLLDVIKGDKQNFVHSDELQEAWRIFTPLLHKIEKNKIIPYPYVFGSSGPEESYTLIRKYYNFLNDSTYKYNKN